MSATRWLLLVDSFAFELQPERLSHRAVAAIGADQEVRSHDLAIRECRFDAVLILCECRQRDAEFDFAAERMQALAQDRFGARIAAPSKVFG